MNTEQNQQEINEIRRHIRYLNITGLTAIAALTIAGVMILSDFSGTDESSSGAILAEIPASMEVGQPRVNPNQATEKQPVEFTSTVVQSTNSNQESISENNKPAAKAELSKPIKSMDEELLSFEASCNQGSLLISWVTIGSVKYGYDIEKSVDKENYEVFTRAPAPEKVDGKNVYRVEESALPNEQAFYRLRKVIGKDKYEYSNGVSVQCSAEAAAQTTVDVFPNGYGSFRILINSPSETKFRVTLTDINEKELAIQDFNAIQGNNEFTLISDSITRGNYVLRVANDHMVKEKKVVLK